MKTIGNIIWFLFVGLGSAIGFFLEGLLWCITIIGIPFGKQAFKLARLMLWPMGTKVETNFGAHPIANVIWLVFGGFGLALGFVFAGIFFCITIIGIPFGKQCFKLAGLSAIPFGAKLS